MRIRTLRAIIVDDEPDCVAVLEMLLKKYCPQVEVVGATTKSTEGVKLITALNPDVVFLDIEMPILNGFQLLDKLDVVNFQLVFTTAYDRYAVQAFRYSAIDFLLKPIDSQELIAAVSKIEHMHAIDQRQLDLLRRHLYPPQKSLVDKIALPYAHGYLFVDLAQIVVCESDGSYTKFFLLNGDEHLITRSLGEVEETLEPNGSFFRLHRQFLINLKHIKRFVRTDGGSVIMQNGNDVPIARNKKEEFTHLFAKL